ncbi:MAG: glycosyltransferase [Chloroflexi bacterium]|nr:glycosyltransferase [Chloroflexota bacterium]
MKKILIMCHADPNSNPRPNRMIRWLKDDFEVTVLSRSEVSINDVKSHVYNPRISNRATNRDGFLRIILQKAGLDKLRVFVRFVLRLANLLFGRYEEANWLYLGGAHTAIPELAKEKFDLVISHDLVLLPLAYRIGMGSAKVLLDAREYYTRHFDDNWIWRFAQKPVNEYLSRTYLAKCDKVITVSPGLSEEYRREYGINAEVVMSLPSREDLLPGIVLPDRIRMIHHGNATSSRRIELMLELMDYLDDRFTLDLMMVATDAIYWNKITNMAKKRANVQIIPPVAMPNIVKTINRYDIGLYLAFPSNFNMTYMLPNKLFEFIQARLAVAISPNMDMKKMVEQYNCGIVSQDFSPQSLALELNKLTPEQIVSLKQNSHQAALKLNADVNGKRILEIIENLIGK